MLLVLILMSRYNIPTKTIFFNEKNLTTIPVSRTKITHEFPHPKYKFLFP
jgi:hypothetical protein